MKNNKLEPQMNFTKSQVFKILEQSIHKNNNAHELFEHMLNILMKSERSAYLESNQDPKNKGNGYRPVRKLTKHGKLKLSIPRDRLGLFKPFIIASLNEQQEQMHELAHQLYCKGLTCRQIEKVFNKMYGQHYSKSTISRINQKYHENIAKWLHRKLDSTYLMVMIDAIHIKVKRETVATEAFYIVLGLNKSYKREILAVVNHPTESALGWEQVLKGLKERGVEQVGLFVSDDLTGLDTSINKVFPKSNHQKCVLHFKRALAGRLRRNYRASFLRSLSDVFDPEASHTSIRAAVERLKRILRSQCDLYPSLNATIARNDLELYFTYLKYDKSIRRMIYTTNWIERFNKSVRRTTKIRDSLPSPHAARMLIGYVAMEAGHETYNYPIHKFANDEKMNELANS